MGLTQAEAARRMRMSTNRLNELIRGKRGVTAATAIRLAELLDTAPELWLNLQTNLGSVACLSRPGAAGGGVRQGSSPWDG
jgi:antitoxin HigA-1